MKNRVSHVVLLIYLLHLLTPSSYAQTLQQLYTSRDGSPPYFTVHGRIEKAVPDQSGGWYLGGNFDNIGGVAVHNAAHINSDMSVDQNWTPNVNGTVLAIAVSDSTVFIGGNWEAINGQNSSGIAAIDRKSGQVINWVPKRHWESVRAIAINDSAVFCGGFSFADGNLFFDFVTAINRRDASLVYWSNSTSGSGEVNVVSISDTLLYIGGSFSHMNQANRNRVASCDLKTGLLTAWNPNISASIVYNLSITDSMVYTAGLFFSGGQSRINLASVTKNTGVTTNWNPNWTYSEGTTPVISLCKHIAYVAGPFTSIEGQDRDSLAAMDLKNSKATDWKPVLLTGYLYSIDASDSTICLGTSLRCYFLSPIANDPSLDVGIVNRLVPQKYSLHQNFPNPFNPSTNIEFDLPSKSFVSLKIFDCLGREMAVLVSEELPAGVYLRRWRPKSTPSGVYFCRLQAGPSFIETNKLLLLK